MYFDKSLKEFKLGNSRIPKAKIPPHPGPADVKQKTALNKKIAKFYIFKLEFLKKILKLRFIFQTKYSSDDDGMLKGYKNGKNFS